MSYIAIRHFYLRLLRYGLFFTVLAWPFALMTLDGGIVFDETLPTRALVALAVLHCTVGFASGLVVDRHLHRDEEPFYFNLGLAPKVRIAVAYLAQLAGSGVILLLAVVSV